MESLANVLGSWVPAVGLSCAHNLIWTGTIKWL